MGYKRLRKRAGIELDQIELTDIDDDDIAEISILYTIRGRSISTVKLIMHEKGRNTLLGEKLVMIIMMSAFMSMICMEKTLLNLLSLVLEDMH